MGVMKVIINKENFSIEEQHPGDTATKDFKVCKLGTSSSALVKFSIALLATKKVLTENLKNLVNTRNLFLIMSFHI